MNPRYPYPSMLLVMLLLLCPGLSFACPDRDKLAWLQYADPIFEAEFNYREGVTQYRAVYGPELKIPGLDETEELASKVSNHYILIDGASGDPCVANLQQVATEYAARYNREMSRLLAQ